MLKLNTRMGAAFECEGDQSTSSCQPVNLLPFAKIKNCYPEVSTHRKAFSLQYQMHFEQQLATNCLSVLQC